MSGEPMTLKQALAALAAKQLDAPQASLTRATAAALPAPQASPRDKGGAA